MIKLSFGMKAVQSGQKSSTVNALPQLIAAATKGKFTLTAPVTKALNLAVGETVMFLNNASTLDEAIQMRHPDILAWEKETGFDTLTYEGAKKCHEMNDMWAIAKGVKLYEKNGSPIMASERFTKEDKEKFLKENAKNYVADPDARAALIERVGNPDATDEELIAALTIDDVEVPKYHATSGSKVATSGTATGVGCLVNFTDTSIWETLKEGLEDKTSKNRIFSVDLENKVEGATYDNGKEEVPILAFPITFKEDVEPLRRGSNGEEVEE